MDFEAGDAVVRAREGGGFDPAQILSAVRDAGFGPGEIRLKVRGALGLHGDLPALSFRGAPGLLVLAGGERFGELEESGPAIGSRILVEGELHPSHADRPQGMEVDRWEEIESENAGTPSADRSSGG